VVAGNAASRISLDDFKEARAMAPCFVSAKATDAHWGSFRHSCDKLHSLPPNSGGQKFALIAIKERFSDGMIIPVTALETPK
jgi:hypothetical protein